MSKYTKGDLGDLLVGIIVLILLCVISVLIGGGCVSPYAPPVNTDWPDIHSVLESCEECSELAGGDWSVPLEILTFNQKIKANYEKAFYPPLGYMSGFTKISETELRLDRRHLENMDLMIQWGNERRQRVLDIHTPVGTPPPIPGRTDYNHVVAFVPDASDAIAPPPAELGPRSPETLRDLYWELQHIRMHYPDHYVDAVKMDKFIEAVEYMRSIGEAY